MSAHDNLPAPLTSFVGREAEIAAVVRQFVAGRLLTLTGTGGIGKTRLAIEVAHTLRDSYPGGVWCVEFGALAEPALVAQSFAAVLGVREAGPRPILELLLDAVPSDLTLLVLDNCEHLLDACAAVCETLLLGPAPGLAAAAADGAMTGWQIYETAGRSRVTGPRSRRPYRITDAGQRAFSSWLADFARDEPRDDILRSPLLLTVFFGDFLPRELLVRVLAEYRARWQRQLDQATQMLGAISAEGRHRPPTAVLRRGVSYRELMVRWIDSVLDELEGLEAPGRGQG